MHFKRTVAKVLALLLIVIMAMPCKTFAMENTVFTTLTVKNTGSSTIAISGNDMSFLLEEGEKNSDTLAYDAVYTVYANEGIKLFSSCGTDMIAIRADNTNMVEFSIGEFVSFRGSNDFFSAGITMGSDYIMFYGSGFDISISIGESGYTVYGDNLKGLTVLSGSNIMTIKTDCQKIFISSGGSSVTYL